MNSRTTHSIRALWWALATDPREPSALGGEMVGQYLAAARTWRGPCRGLPDGQCEKSHPPKTSTLIPAPTRRPLCRRYPSNCDEPQILVFVSRISRSACHYLCMQGATENSMRQQDLRALDIATRRGYLAPPGRREHPAITALIAPATWHTDEDVANRAPASRAQSNTRFKAKMNEIDGQQGAHGARRKRGNSGTPPGGRGKEINLFREVSIDAIHDPPRGSRIRQLISWRG